MSGRHTLMLIKPNAVKNEFAEQIFLEVHQHGFKILACKKLQLSKNEAEAFYFVHKGKPFFDGLVEFMTSAPVIVQILEGEDAIAKYRKIMGATNPDIAEEGTIRKTFAISIDKNSVHGSDSPEASSKEINFFFSQVEIFN